jgi:hypothetical protein
MIFTTQYSSAAGPDVRNIALELDPDPGLISAVDNAIKNLKVATGQKNKKEGGDAEYESMLAGLINDDFWNEAESAMTAEELEDYEKSQNKRNIDFGKIESEGINQAGQAIAFAKNPMSIVAPLMGMLPHTALIALAVSLIPLIIDELKKPGSMYDVRFRRIMTDEFNAFMERQEQWNAQIGLRNVYVQSHSGFLIQNGAAQTESTLRQVRESVQRVAPMDFTDHAKELFP